MPDQIIALLGEKSDKYDISVVKGFEFDPDEGLWTTGEIEMTSASDGSQYGTATLLIDDQGNGKNRLTLSAKFVNKRKFDGDHFFASAALLNGKGEKLEHLQVERGLDGTWKHAFQTQHGGRSISKDGVNISDAAMIVFSLGFHDTANDEVFWKKAGEIGQKILAAYAGGTL